MTIQVVPRSCTHGGPHHHRTQCPGAMASHESIFDGRRLVSLGLLAISLLLGVLGQPVAKACSSHGTNSGSAIRIDPVSGDIAITDNLVAPNGPTICVAGIGLGSTETPLPPGVKITGLMIMITNTADGTRTPFPPFSFSLNRVTAQALAAGSGSRALDGTHPLFGGSAWFGFSSPVEAFTLPPLGPDEVIELSFVVELPPTLSPVTVDIQFAAGEGSEDGTPIFTGIHPVQYFAPARNRVTLTSRHTITGVLDGASFRPLISPGSIASIFGSFAERITTAENLPLPISLDGLIVRIGGVPAPIFVVVRGAEFDPPLGFDQMNVQVPWEADVAAGKLDIELSWGLIASTKALNATFQVDAATASPGIFSFQFGAGPAIMQNVSLGGDDVIPGSFAHTADTLPGLDAQPAAVGGVITVWANGLGPVSPAVPTGDIPERGSPLLETTKPIRLWIGGAEATILGSPILHPSFVGLNQLNARIPQDVAAGDKVPIQIEVDCGEGNVLWSRVDNYIAVRPVSEPGPIVF